MKSILLKPFLFLIYCLSWPIVKLYLYSCRIKHHGPLYDYLKEEKPVLLTWWHQDMLFNFSFLTQFASQRRIATLVSRSSDGEMASYLVEKHGTKTFRGSSSRGGSTALKQLTAYIKEREGIGVIVCDGPRPPGRVAKFGIVALARETGLPIIMVRSWARNQYIFKKSWPKLLVTYPFSSVVMLSEGPLSVPADTSHEDLEKYRIQVEEGLNRLADQSEAAFI